MTLLAAPRIWTAAATLLLVAGCASSAEHGPDHAVATSTASARPPAPETEPIDTKTWTSYTSDWADLKVGHPPDWTVEPATRSWRGDADSRDPLSPAHEAFQSPNGDVRVSVWSVPLDRGVRTESSADIEAWVEEYCEASHNAPCTGIEDRAVELCLEKRDCHPGLLVPFRYDVQAFFSGGIYNAWAMTIVAVWRNQSHPAVAPYGGAQPLLEAFLSTMDVWPAQ